MEKDCELKKNEKGKLYCASKFFVSALEVKNKKITHLEVTRQRSKTLPEAVVFSWWAEPQAPSEPQKFDSKPISHGTVYTVCSYGAEQLICTECGKPIEGLKVNGKVKTPAEIAKGCGGLCYSCWKAKQ